MQQLDIVRVDHIIRVERIHVLNAEVSTGTAEHVPVEHTGHIIRASKPE
jgi:hypothetical protein